MRGSLILRGALLVTLCILVLWSMSGDGERAVRDFFHIPSSGTITILTHPVPVLPPHTHRADQEGVDSLFDAGHGVTVTSDVLVTKEDVWITGIQNIANNAPASVLHHLLLQQVGTRDAYCANRPSELAVIGSDTDYKLSLPPPYGLFVPKGTRLYLSGMLHNPLPKAGPGKTYTDVSFGFRITYETNNPRRSVRMYYQRLNLDEGVHCEDGPGSTGSQDDRFTVPAGKQDFVFSSRTASSSDPGRYTFTKPGLVFLEGGHLHESEGGKKIDLFLNDKLLHTIVPQRAPVAWNKLEVTTFRVRPGDTLSIEATYSNPFPFPIRDAMGIVGFLYAPDPETL